MTAPYTGRMWLDPDTRLPRGVLRDRMGVELHLTAARTAEGYDLTATVALPAEIALPWDDTEA